MRTNPVRKSLLYIGIVFVLVGGGFVAQRTFAAARAALAARPGHAALARQQDLARAEGIPLSPEEFAPNAPAPDAENAAPLYRQAAALSRRIDRKDHLLQHFDPFHFDSAQSVEANRRYLRQAQPVLDLVATAAKRPNCELNSESSSTEVDYAAFADFNLIARVAAGQAELDAHDGHPAKALEAVATFAPLCGHLAQTHTIIAAALQGGVDTTFTRVIGDILGHHGGEAGVAVAADKALKALGPMPDLVRMAEEENLLSLEVLGPEYMESHTKPGAEAGAKPIVKHIIELARRPGMVDHWRAVQIEATRRQVELFKSSIGDGRDLRKKSDALNAELSQPNDDAHAWRRFAGALDWSGTIDELARRIEERRVLEAAAKVLDQSIQAGASTGSKGALHLPETLTESTDHLGSGALHYKRTGNGFNIYGDIEHDEQLRSPKMHRAGYDVAFTYPAKPERKVIITAIPRRLPLPGPPVLMGH